MEKAAEKAKAAADRLAEISIREAELVRELDELNREKNTLLPQIDVYFVILSAQAQAA